MPIDVLERLRRANPVPGDLPAPPLQPLLDRLEATPAAPAAGRLSGVLALTLAVAVVVLVVAVALGTAGNGHRSASPAPARSSLVVLQAQSPAGGAPGGREIQQAVAILGHRLVTVSSHLRATRTGADQITIAGVSPRERAQVLQLTRPGDLSLYDWEANALTPNGKTVASQLAAPDRDALKISQGASAAPGSPGAGGVGLYQAVKLASMQPVVEADGSHHLSRTRPQYYLFGTPDSPACATVARQAGTTVIPGRHCLLAGPAASLPGLQAGLPSGLTLDDGRRLTVPPGTVVLQAANPSAASLTAFESPAAQFYVLKDNVALTGAEITNPRASTDQSGSPNVTFGFNSRGNTQFRTMTAQVAHRGAVTSTTGQMLNQHFAIALDNELLTVPSIDYRSYPNGVSGHDGADISGSFTTETARETAALLRDGALPVTLTPASR